MTRSIVRLLALIGGCGVLYTTTARADPLQKAVGNPQAITDAAGATTSPKTTAPSNAPTTAKSDKSSRTSRADPAKNPALTSAIEALSKEYDEALQAGAKPSPKAKPVPDAKPGSPVFRKTSDYFVKNPADIPPVDAILAFLDKPAKGDIQQQAYVKWQLLSGLGEKLDPKNLSKAVAAYDRAPPPVPQLGLGQDRNRLDSIAKGVKEEDELLVRRKYEVEREKVEEANIFIVAYRDEFYRKLPVTSETIKAGFKDAYVRGQNGCEVEEFVPKIVANVKFWINRSDTDPGSAKQMTELVTKLHKVPMPPFAGVPSWDKAKNSFQFSPATVTLNPKNSLGELQKFLSERKPRGDTTVRFKNEKR